MSIHTLTKDDRTYRVVIKEEDLIYSVQKMPEGNRYTGHRYTLKHVPSGKQVAEIIRASDRTPRSHLKMMQISRLSRLICEEYGEDITPEPEKKNWMVNIGNPVQAYMQALHNINAKKPVSEQVKELEAKKLVSEQVKELEAKIANLELKLLTAEEMINVKDQTIKLLSTRADSWTEFCDYTNLASPLEACKGDVQRYVLKLQRLFESKGPVADYTMKAAAFEKTRKIFEERIKELTQKVEDSKDIVECWDEVLRQVRVIPNGEGHALSIYFSSYNPSNMPSVAFKYIIRAYINSRKQHGCDEF